MERLRQLVPSEKLQWLLCSGDAFLLFTLAHELGHLMWADHNTEDAMPPEPLVEYGHGYRREPEIGLEAPGWATAMSVTQTCQGPCVRINRWSSPSYTNNQGEALGTEQMHDNTRVLNEMKSIVADFYPDPPPAQRRALDAEPKLYTPTSVGLSRRAEEALPLSR